MFRPSILAKYTPIIAVKNIASTVLRAPMFSPTFIIKNIDFIPENNLVARKDGIYEWNNIDERELQNIEAKINHYFTVRNCLNVSIYPQDLLISDKHDIEPLEYPFKTKVRDKTEVIIIKNLTFSEILDQLDDNYYYLLLDYRIMATNDQIESITNPTLNPINEIIARRPFLFKK